MAPHLGWSNETKIFLIQEIQKWPILWNRKYRDLPVTGRLSNRSEAWKSVAWAMSKSVNDCQKAWISCRTMYRRLKRQLELWEPGTAPVDLSWFGYHYMGFLDEALRSDEDSTLNGDSIQQDSPNNDSDAEVAGPSGLSSNPPAAAPAPAAAEEPAAPQQPLLKVVKLEIEDDPLSDDATTTRTPSPQVKPQGRPPTNTQKQEPQEPAKDEDEEMAESSSGESERMAVAVQKEPTTPASSTTLKICNDYEPPPMSDRAFVAFGQYVAAELCNMPRRAAIILQQRLHHCIIDSKLYGLPPD